MKTVSEKRQNSTINIDVSYEIIESLDTFMARAEEPILVDLCGTGGSFLGFSISSDSDSTDPKTVTL